MVAYYPSQADDSDYSPCALKHKSSCLLTSALSMIKPRMTPDNERYFARHVEPLMFRALIECDRARRERLLRQIANCMRYSRAKTVEMMRVYERELAS